MSSPAHTTSPPELVERLAFARENFTPELERARALLERVLTERGCAPETHAFEAVRGENEMSALLLILAATCILAGAWRRSRGALLGVVAAAGVMVLISVGTLPGAPRAPLHNLQVVIEPRADVRSELILSAHYDTKTEWLDHVERSGVFALTFVLMTWACIAVGRRAHRARLAATLAGVALVACAIQLVSGHLLRQRSPGVVDDAAACVVLVELAEALREAPAAHTRVRFVWFAGEEIGAQGSAAFVRDFHPTLPTRVLNLEGIGAGPRLGWGALEWTPRGIRSADATLADALADAPRAENPPPVRVPYPLWTDAGAFMAAGIPALTVVNLLDGARTLSDLHGPRDDLARFDARGFARTRDALQRIVAHVDALHPAP